MRISIFRWNARNNTVVCSRDFYIYRPSGSHLVHGACRMYAVLPTAASIACPSTQVELNWPLSE